MPLPITAKVTESFVYINRADVPQIIDDDEFVSIHDLTDASITYNITGEVIGYYGGTLTIID